jgi:predicted Fe-Mo cluster-binding NifX family protein
MTVLAKAPEARLSPFFTLAPWLRVHDNHSEDFRHFANQDWTVEHLIELICAENPDLLICGHIPPEAAQIAQRKGIDVRIGPCSVPATTLIARAHALPRPIIRVIPDPGT